MLLKVCGMREPDNILAVAQAIRPDYMGLIFYPPSPRHVSYLSPDVLHQLPASLRLTGVFVDAPLSDIRQAVRTYGLRAVQLHGLETPDFCQTCRETLSVEVLKAFSIATPNDLQPIAYYQKAVDFALLDTKGQQVGGNGVTFDWRILQDYSVELPFFLSGGISPENWLEVKQLHHPYLAGVDVNSRFELRPALKDVAQLAVLRR